ncbi:MAG TPA: hypothetical protein VK430_11235 [Xanthobacteraceae bacterium]|nr:hypothetical protein [Xanthobacteraceae bacterium]
MDRFVALSLPNREKIDAAIGGVKKFHSQHRSTVYASALVAKDADGKLSVQEITKEGHGGTAVGAFLGALAGLPAGPAAAAIMAAGGAVIGNAADLTTEGDFTKLANGIAREIAPGGAIIVAELAEDSVSAFKAEMQGIGGTVLVTR